jgi:ribose transport system permease protein
MSAAAERQTSSSAYSHLFIPIVLLFALLVVAVIRSPSLVTNAGLGSALIVAAPMILATYALTFIVMAGRGGVDLSIGPLIGFLNVTMVQLFESKYLETPFQFFVYAIAVGIAYQLLMGFIIVYVRIQPIIVALSGYLTLSGLNLMILPRPGGTAPEWMSSWGLGESIWTPVLAILIIATGAWFVFARTAFYDHLRLMGSDERTAYASGVNITAVRLGAHVIAGIYAGLAALTFTSLISSGDPTQGSTYTLLTVTALVLGGTSLAGGRGSITGSLLGALNIYLITYVLATFSFGKIQSFVTQLSYGTILVAALLLTIFLPQVQRATRKLSPSAFFVFLSLVALGVMIYAKDTVRIAQYVPAGQPAGQSLSGQSLSGQSLSGQSLSDSGGQSLSGQSSGESLSGQSLSGESLSSQAPAGEPLSGQSLSGESLSTQAPAGESLSGQSLSGQSLSGQSLSAGGAEPQAAPEGTPLVIAAVIIAAAFFLLYLLYRYLNLYTLAFVAAVALLVLGYGVHDSALLAQAAASQAAAALPPIPFFSLSRLPELMSSAEGSGFASHALSLAAVAAGTVLFASILIFTTVPQANSRIGEMSLWFMAVAAAAAILLLVYLNSEFLQRQGTLTASIAPLLVGAVLFIVTLPGFQKRIRNITVLMIALLAITALAATFFSTMAFRPATEAPAAAASPVASDVALPATALALPEAFLTQALALLVIAVAGFLLTIPRVRRHVLSGIKLDSRAASYTYISIFIGVAAVAGLGALFVQNGVAMWKFIVAVLAAFIGARFFLYFLFDFRRRGGVGGGMALGRHVGSDTGEQGA